MDQVLYQLGSIKFDIMHICQKYMKFSSFTHFCRESKSVAIHALYSKSFCVKNLAIRKVFAFSDSVLHQQCWDISEEEKNKDGVRSYNLRHMAEGGLVPLDAILAQRGSPLPR